MSLADAVRATTITRRCPTQLCRYREAMDPPAATSDGGEARRYAAFISYRHVEPDRRWAKWLHAALETYRVPAAARAARRVPPRVGQVFRDEEELPASSELKTEIDTALRASDFLIVVCSPRTPESLWVNTEVQRFRELGRGDRILALLIEGEPRTSFPRSLVEIRRRAADDPSAAAETIEQVEPLAADVRAIRPEPARYLKRMARLRLLSCLLGVPFDDLRRRDAERRTRRLTLAAGVLVLVAGTMTVLAAAAIAQRNLAVAARGEADRQRDAAVRQAYAASFTAASVARESGDVARARQLLDECPPTLRQWEWSYLLGCCDNSLHTFEHDADVTAVAVSDDQRRVATASGKGEVRLWDGQTGAPMATASLGARVNAVRLSRDASTLAALTDDGRVVVLEGDGLAMRCTIGGRNSSDRTLELSPDGARAVTLTPDRALELWDVSAAAAARLAVLHVPADYAGPLRSANGSRVGTAFSAPAAAFGEDGRRLATGFRGGARLWDATTGARLHDLTGHADAVGDVSFSGDGARLLTASADRTARVWDVATGTAVATLAGDARPLRTGRLSREGRFAVTVCDDGTARRWDVAAGKPLRTFGDPGGADSLYFAGCAGADDTLVAAVGSGGRTTAEVLRAWAADSGAPRGEFFGLTDAVTLGTPTLSPDGKRLLAAGGRTVKVWSLESPATPGRAAVAAELRRNVYAVAFSADGRRVVAGTEGGAVHLLDAATGDRVAVFRGHMQPADALADALPNPPHGKADRPNSITGVAFTADGTSVVSGAVDGTLRLLDAATLRQTKRLEFPKTAVMAVAISPDGRLVAAAISDGTARIVDVNSWTEVASIPASTQTLTTLAFSPDGRTLATTGFDNDVGLWDAATWRRRATAAVAGGGARRCVRFSPDGTTLAVTDDAEVARLIRVTDGVEIAALRGHNQSVRGAAFSPDGRRLVTSCYGYDSQPGDARVWDVDSGRQMLVIRSPTA
jgi:WD40 repeat protein